jgi:hypothetical protein
MILPSVKPCGAVPGRLRATRNRFRELRGMEHALNFRRIKILPGETLIIHYGATGRLEIRRLQSGVPGPNQFPKSAAIIDPAASITPKTSATLAPGTVKTRAGLGGGVGRDMVCERVAASATPINPKEFDELAALRKSQCWDTPIFQPSHPSYRRVMARLRELEAKEQAASG